MGRFTTQLPFVHLLLAHAARGMRSRRKCVALVVSVCHGQVAGVSSRNASLAFAVAGWLRRAVCSTRRATVLLASFHVFRIVAASPLRARVGIASNVLRRLPFFFTPGSFAVFSLSCALFGPCVLLPCGIVAL